jgi:Fe-S-cluster containining protein
MQYQTEEIFLQGKKVEKENKQLVDRLIRKRPNNLDTVIEELHDAAFAQINCMNCGNCCKTTSPVFKQKDIDRLSKHLKMKPGAFVEKYSHIDSDQDYVLNSAPCAFLNSDNSCSVYDFRPLACQTYPHTNRKKFYQLLKLSFNNTLICPAVQHVFEGLKRKYP